jgi:hypothetical protein
MKRNAKESSSHSFGFISPENYHAKFKLDSFLYTYSSKGKEFFFLVPVFGVTGGHHLYDYVVHYGSARIEETALRDFQFTVVLSACWSSREE